MLFRGLQTALFLSLLLLLGSGCVSKNVYEPKKEVPELAFKESPEKIKVKDVVREGATLSNRKVLSKRSGLVEIVIPKGFSFVNDDKESLIVANNDGDLEIFSKRDGHKIFVKKFEDMVVSATLKGDLLALVLAKNKILLYDIKQDKLLYEEALDKVITIDARAANPLFLNDLVIFPTLDGRLLIMDANRKVILRDVAISDKELFNNVIFLKVHNNNLVAATASKVIVITPKNIYTYQADVKDILYIGNAIYLFTKDGSVIWLDEKLNEVKKQKFEFANFVAVSEMNGKLYGVERNGYLIELDKKLGDVKVQKLFDEVEKPAIIVKDMLYIDDKKIALP